MTGLRNVDPSMMMIRVNKLKEMGAIIEELCIYTLSMLHKPKQQFIISTLQIII